jgi:hypothetical protein
MSGDLEAHLYESHTRPAALHLVGLEDAREACGGQLIIGRDQATWLAAPPEGSFPTPSRFGWSATRRYREADDEFWFLPVEVRKRGVSTEEGIEMFFAPEGKSEFLYLGPGRLTSYGFSNRTSFGEAQVHLERKLPEQIWLRLGGYEGWSLTIDGQEQRGLSDTEVATLVEAAIAKGAGELWLTRYEDDSLGLLIEPARVFFTYLAFDGDSGVIARDPEAQGSPETASFILSNGQVDDIPYEETLPKDGARFVVQHFVDTGELAPWVTWSTD